MKSVSIVIPASKGRGWLLDKTLASIRKQRYPGPLEIIVVEDGYDAHILSICQQHSVKHMKCLRTESFPEFQNPARIRNLGIKAASNEILMIQDCEIIHTCPTVLQDLVNRVGDDRKVMATAVLANLDKDGKFAGWYNHPGSPKYGIMGGCLQAIYRETVLAMGGFEESFFGYGYEDNFYVWMLGKNKIETCFVDTALTEHQWHPKTLFEPFTGNANRALAWTLVAEIEWEGRPPIANYQAPTSSEFVESYDTVAELIRTALEIFHDDRYTAWAEGWLTGKNITHDASFEARDIASAIRTDAPDSVSIPAYVAMKAAEAAWGLALGGALLRGICQAARDKCDLDEKIADMPPTPFGSCQRGPSHRETRAGRGITTSMNTCQGIGIGATCGEPATCWKISWGVDASGDAVQKKIWLCAKHFGELNKRRGEICENRISGKF